jgi:hypothetical protein
MTTGTIKHFVVMLTTYHNQTCEIAMKYNIHICWLYELY